MFYVGVSLGSIEGAVVQAVDPFHAALLHVGGSTWSTMLERSSNWPVFEDLLVAGVPSARDRQLGYALSQLYWDPVDPANYVAELRQRSVLWQESIGDDAHDLIEKPRPLDLSSTLQQKAAGNHRDGQRANE